MYTPFIAVHVGAGRHNKKYDPELIECCNNACFATMSDLKDGKSAIAAVENAVKILEDNPLTNSGTGSSLTKSGFVECDAGLMDGKSGMFGCIGAVPDVKNPISAARCLLDDQINFISRNNLALPVLLVGQGAWEYARSKGIANPRNFLPFQGPMVTKKSIERHNKYSTHAFSHNNIQEDGDSSTKIYDTVGAIALDNEGNVAAAVSTGGVVLKHSGRVGDSAIPGSGFWAESSNLEDHNSNLSLACSTTGLGEQLIYFDFARALVKEFKNSIHCDQSDIVKNFFDSFIKKHSFSKMEPSAGFILLCNAGNNLEFWYGFTTESMGLGYFYGTDLRPTSIIDRKSSGKNHRISGIFFKQGAF